MKTNHLFHCLTLASAVTGLAIPAAVNAQDQPERPKIDLKINGKQVDIKDIKEFAERAMNEMRVPEETRRMLRHRLADGAARAEGNDQAAAVPQWPAGPHHEPADPGAPTAWKLGIACEPLDELLHAHLPIPKDVGLVVRQVMNDSPAAKAGLRVNDVLLTANDRPLQSFPQLVEAVHNAGNSGQPLVLKFLHEGREQTVVIKPEGPPPTPQGQPGGPGAPNMGVPFETARVVGELREMLGRQQHELGELRKHLAAQQQEIRKLRDMVEKDAN